MVCLAMLPWVWGRTLYMLRRLFTYLFDLDQISQMLNQILLGSRHSSQRQSGHLEFVSSHRPMQPPWYTCEHGNWVASTPLPNSSKHIAQFSAEAALSTASLSGPCIVACLPLSSSIEWTWTATWMAGMVRGPQQWHPFIAPKAIAWAHMSPTNWVEWLNGTPAAKRRGNNISLASSEGVVGRRIMYEFLLWPPNRCREKVMISRLIGSSLGRTWSSGKKTRRWTMS